MLVQNVAYRVFKWKFDDIQCIKGAADKLNAKGFFSCETGLHCVWVSTKLVWTFIMRHRVYAAGFTTISAHLSTHGITKSGDHMPADIHHFDQALLQKFNTIPHQHIHAVIPNSEMVVAVRCSPQRYAYNNHVFKELAIKRQAANNYFPISGKFPCVCICLKTYFFLSHPYKNSALG